MKTSEMVKIRVRSMTRGMSAIRVGEFPSCAMSAESSTAIMASCIVLPESAYDVLHEHNKLRDGVLVFFALWIVIGSRCLDFLVARRTSWLRVALSWSHSMQRSFLCCLISAWCASLSSARRCSLLSHSMSRSPWCSAVMCSTSCLWRHWAFACALRMAIVVAELRRDSTWQSIYSSRQESLFWNGGGASLISFSMT